MRIRQMTSDDLRVVLGWAADEGWNPGTGDGEFLAIPDPAGLLVAVEDGEPIGSIGMLRFGPRFAFAGLYVVRPDHRGGATGARLARAALAHAGDRTIGTDGVIERTADYEALGFRVAHLHHRHSGAPGPAAHPCVRNLSPGDVDVVIALDDACFPGDRRVFMRAWLGGGHLVRCWAPDGGEVSGVGVARRAVAGWRIGPLIAPHAGAAEAIVRDLAAALPGEVLHIDVNTGNPEAANLATDLGMAPGFACVRMYRNGMPELPLTRIWGACTLEAG